MSKPYRGELFHWRRVPFDAKKMSEFYNEDVGLGYTVAGFTTETPKLGSSWRTSWVVRFEDRGSTSIIETRNSLYKLIGPEVQDE